MFITWIKSNLLATTVPSFIFWEGILIKEHRTECYTNKSDFILTTLHSPCLANMKQQLLQPLHDHGIADAR